MIPNWLQEKPRHTPSSWLHVEVLHTCLYNCKRRALFGCVIGKQNMIVRSEREWEHLEGRS